MKITHFGLCFIVALVVSGCMKDLPFTQQKIERQMPVVPFTFQVKAFEDMRQSDDLIDALNAREFYAFDEQRFFMDLVGTLNHSPFYASSPAHMSVALKDYASVRKDNRYVMAYTMGIKVHSPDHGLLSSGQYSCTAEGTQGFDLKGSVKSIYGERSFDSVGGNVKIWEEVTKKCLEDIAYELKGHVLEWRSKWDTQ